MGKLHVFVLCSLIFFWTAASNVYAAPPESKAAVFNAQKSSGMGDSDSELDYSKVQQTMDEMLPEDSKMSFSDVVAAFSEGSITHVFEQLKAYVADQLLYELEFNKAALGQMLGIVLISAVFTNFSMAFNKSLIADTGFYLTYMVLFTLLLTSFHAAVSVAESLMENMLKFMSTLVPTFCLALTFAGHLKTAAVYQQVMLAVLTALEWLVSRGILKLIHMYVLICLMNQLSKDDYLSKLADFFHTVIKWLLKTILGVVLGLNIVQGMVMPAFDSVKNGLAVRVVSVVPGVGDAMESAVKTVVGGAAIIKNAVGGAGIFILALLFLIPALKLACMVLMYQLSQALVQPVADKRMIKCLHGVSEGILLLMKVLGTVFVLFVISLAMITSSSGILFGG